MILLEKLLAGLDVSIAPFVVCQAGSDRAVTFKRNASATLHYAVAGDGALRVDTYWSADFRPHTLIVAPPGVRIELLTGDDGDVRPMSAEQCCKTLDAGWAAGRSNGGAGLTTMVCAPLQAKYHGSHGLFDYLDQPLVEDLSREESVRATFQQLFVELADPQPGTNTMAEAMLRQCLVILLRRYCESGECRLPWLAALEDPRFSRVLEVMLDCMADDLTVEDLARVAGMSRSAFAQQFHAAFEKSPIEFLRVLRMNAAARLLGARDLPVKAVAARVGYHSRSQFSRAFKGHFGKDPADYRRSGPA